MWHKFYKKVLSFCLAIMMATTVFSPNISVYGASIEDTEEVVTVSDTSTVLTRGNFLNYGTIAMSKVSSTRIMISEIGRAHV